MRLCSLRWFAILLVILPAVVLVTGAQVEIRSSVATGNYTWTADNFAGFYYDIDKNMKTESLTTTVSGGNMLSGNVVDGVRGVVYNTTAQQQEFEFAGWGSYNIIGFLAEKYFAGYVDTPNRINDVLYTESTDKSVLSNQQLLKILIDDDNEETFDSNTPLRLKEGYALRIISIDVDGSGVYVELTKDGESVDSEVISPDSSSVVEQTYFYKTYVGDSSDIVLIAVHFQSVFLGGDTAVATIDGVWQLSDTLVDVAENSDYGKMTVQKVTADSITMDNEDNDITLSKDNDIPLMPGISIKTANSDDLRYYIYTEETCE